MAKKYKCPYCNERYIRKDLITHIDEEHEDVIPDGFESAQIVYDVVNGTKGAGKCRVCGRPTKWNSSAKRYDVLCENPMCKQKMREEYQKNMLRVHGTYNILTSDEQQKKMLANRSISGKYKFADGGVVTYTGSYEKKFLEFADKVMQISSKDIMAPGPTIEYEMNGEKHFYITDFLYIPYNLIIEVKDGGNNPNNKNSVGMQSSRQRTIEKEKLITDRGEYHYLRLTDNQFVQLLEIFMDIKKALIEGNDGKVVRINESTDIFTSGDFAEYKEAGEKRLEELMDEDNFHNEIMNMESVNKSHHDDNLSAMAYAYASAKYLPEAKLSYANISLEDFKAYHLVPKIAAANKNRLGGWDEELYYKTIDDAIRDVGTHNAVKRYNSFEAYVFTAGKNLKAIYIGTILIRDKSNHSDWEWVEQAIIKDSDYKYLKKYPMVETLDISNFYDEDFYE